MATLLQNEQINNSIIIYIDGKPLDISIIDFSKLDTSKICFKIYEIGLIKLDNTTIINLSDKSINTSFIKRVENKNFNYWYCLQCKKNNLLSNINCIQCNEIAPNYIISMIIISEFTLKEIHNYFIIENIPNLSDFIAFGLILLNKYIIDYSISQPSYLIKSIYKILFPILEHILQNAITNSKYSLRLTDTSEDMLKIKYNYIIKKCMLVYSNIYYIEFLSLYNNIK